MADKVCQNGTSAAIKNSEVKSICDSSTKLAVFEGDSPKVLTDRLLDLQSLSVEELMKIAEAQMIESELEKQLEIKHHQELLEHVLRQHEEMRELKEQLKTMHLEEGSGTSMSSSTGQPASVDSLVIPQVLEKDGKWQSMGSEEWLDVPLSPKLSSLEEEVLLGETYGEADGMFALNNKVITSGPQELPNESFTDRELEYLQCGNWKTKQDNAFKQVTWDGSLRIPKLMQPKYEPQKVQLPLVNERPKGLKFNTHLFKTEICRRWTEVGYCPYRESCQFAHGAKELRMRPKMHRKFKTVRCRKYLAGYCPYGTRCCFVHDFSEQRMKVPGRSHYLTPGRDAGANWTGRYSYAQSACASSSVRDMEMRRCRSRQVTTYHPRQQRIECHKGRQPSIF